ncbi:MAG: hypothetical protein KDI09_18045, partial [Halioglobus sp.]|nr:hypothetical protein [Halioglobus sp.]
RARAQARARASEAYSQRIEPASAPETSRLQALSSLAASGDHAGLVAMATHSEPTLVPAERALLRNAHIALADAAEESGDLETALAEIQAAMIALPQPTDPLVEKTFELRSDLSQAAYREGARLLQRDLDGAIKALETALRYNPYNGDARRKLDQANTLQRNLRKIEGLR